MKCHIILGSDEEEKIVIYAKERTALIDEIEKLAGAESTLLIGYGNEAIYKLEPENIECIISEDGRVYAICDKGKLRIRERLYVIEKMLDGVFIKLNQSCLANIKMIDRFESSFAGAIRAVFKSGYKDYISRRQLKAVKERIGFKL
ncbi:MAG: LytTR family transcriptional regulator [Clostridia bacterium]|nr:LytTR family transcriptional regulator [Clostridia bacterium]